METNVQPSLGACMSARLSTPLFAGLTALAMLSAATAVVEPLPLLSPADTGAIHQCAPSCGQVTVVQSSDPAAPGLIVNTASGEDGYPGLGIKPAGESWDLSAFGHVEARIVNMGEKTLRVHLRIDNDGDWRDNPWNTESIHIKPGETGTARVIFGYQYGLKPGYKLDPSRIVHVLIFTDKAKEPISFRIESLTAAGPAGEKPPVKPENVRIKPVGGYVLGGGGMAFDAEKQVVTKDGATCRVVMQGDRQFLHLDFPAGKSTHDVTIRPPIGRWDFTQACEVRVKLRNVGATAIGLGVQVTSDRYHGTAKVSAGVPPMADARQLFVVSFEASDVWEGPSGPVTKAHTPGKRDTGTTFCSDKVDAVRISVTHDGEAALVIESIEATVTPVRTPPWLGKRPPVEGEWTLTFSDDFDGDAIDLTRWGPYRYNVAMHWDGYGKSHKSVGSSNIYIRPDSDGFITCGLLWVPGSAVYYCNGKVVARWDHERVSRVPAYPILYMVTGGWDNSPLDDTQLPADFTIDYVRVWQRKDLARD